MPSRFIFTSIGEIGIEPIPYRQPSIASAKQASVLFDEILFQREFYVQDGGVLREVSAAEKVALEARGIPIVESASTSDFFPDDPQAPPVGHGAFNNLTAILPALGCDWARDAVLYPDHIDYWEDNWRSELRHVARKLDAAVYDPSGSASAPGAVALEVVVPDLTKLPWEAIAEFRAHSGSDEARLRLREYDERARRQGLEQGDLQGFEAHVGRAITRDLLAAWAETRPKVGAELAKEAIRTAIGFVPFVGQVASSTSSLVELASDRHRHDRSWLSALWDLRSAGEQ